MNRFQQRFSITLLVSCLTLGQVFAADKLLVVNATLLTLEEGQDTPINGYMLVDEEGKISALEAGAPPAETMATTVYDAEGKVVMPGFLSGHSHLWQSAYRGIAADELVREWVGEIHRTYGPYFVAGDPYIYTLHGSLDYLRHGITTIYNYSQNLGFTPEVYEEQFQAELDAGARFIFGYALTNREPLEEVKANFETFLEKVEAMPPNPLLLKVNIASSGVGRSDEYTAFEFELMRKHGLDMQMHYLEPPNYKEEDRALFYRIEQVDGLSPKLVFAHFIHTTDYILEKSAEGKVGMIWNPLSNGRLASGLADIPKYLEAGISVGMGIDGQASADISDPFENMRMGLYGLRMKYQDAKIMQPIDVMRLHTLGTAKTLGVADKVGTLTLGKHADFIVVDPTDMDTGPVSDIYATIVFACSIANLDRVYVGGDYLIDRGNPRHHDIKAIADEVKRRVAADKDRLKADQGEDRH